MAIPISKPMKIAIHQPNFLPWLGYFYKMANCDFFILLDNVQYEKNGPTNRVKIKTSQGPIWLTLPVKRNFPQLINETELVDFSKQKEKIIKTLSLNFQKAKYFNFLLPELQKVLEKDWRYLSQLNIELIKLIKEKLKIKTKLEIASNYEVFGKGTDLLVNLCKTFNADTYLSGQGGKKYQDEEKFKLADIKLEYTDFIHPVYPQLWKDFIPGLSAIDLIFNCGPKSLDFLLTNKQI